MGIAKQLSINLSLFMFLQIKNHLKNYLMFNKPNIALILPALLAISKNIS